jgi:hypothetical protein
MRRRDFITLLGGAAVAWPIAARAQQMGKVPRVGVLVSLSAPHPFTEAFRSGLHDLGYIEGRNIAIEWRYADAQFSRALKLAEELVQLPVDVIAAYHTPAVKAAMNATKTIPIVMAPAGAPLELGLVESLARPGGNVTGLSNTEAELGGKRLEVLRGHSGIGPRRRSRRQDRSIHASFHAGPRARRGARGAAAPPVDGRCSRRVRRGLRSHACGWRRSGHRPTELPAVDPGHRGAGGKVPGGHFVELQLHDARRRFDLLLGGPRRTFPARRDVRRQNSQGRQSSYPSSSLRNLNS